MLRIIILMAFTFIFMHLHATGDITKYINMRYSYISFSAIFIFLALTLAQLYFYMRGEDQHGHDHDHGPNCSCGHDHAHDEDKWYKKLVIYPILIVPFASVMFFPVATLDSSTVEAKGFHFPILHDGGSSSLHQFLEPDTSTYYGADYHQKMMDQTQKYYKDKNTIKLEGPMFLKGMEALYHYPGEFTGKNIELTGFSYNNKDLKDNQLFVFRFGIIHCIADAGVYGMLLQFPKDMKMENDQWLTVKGKMSTMYYQPLKKTIPVLNVTGYEKISKPKDPYAYWKFN
ncbi:TIGR03943 family putative permease subunit [Priestia koreensis]|uniref:TIGR03943 family putative permease subunit n=1 Tax=Priestia koreensis TaxID=284581 RepID=UPI001F5833DF|nr:TIGR03943 family protein [Priestia koreensis]UNL82915.1 TIGR03943 family protein [Priestia koreensis]